MGKESKEIHFGMDILIHNVIRKNQNEHETKECKGKKYIEVLDDDVTWICRRVEGAETCLSSITEREHSKDKECWKCERKSCNFYVCISCFEAEMLINAIISSKIDKKLGIKL